MSELFSCLSLKGPERERVVARQTGCPHWAAGQKTGLSAGRRTEAVLVFSREFAVVDANPVLTGARYTTAPMVNFDHFRNYQEADTFSRHHAGAPAFATGRVHKFSLERMLRFARRLDQDVAIVVRPKRSRGPVPPRRCAGQRTGLSAGRRTEAVLVFSREFPGVDANPTLTGARYTTAPMVNFDHFSQLSALSGPTGNQKPFESLAFVEGQPMIVFQEKIAPTQRLPADVLLCRRTITSLEQENALLKERLAQQSLATLAPQLD
jgi:hypothetical protein